MPVIEYHYWQVTRSTLRTTWYSNFVQLDILYIGTKTINRLHYRFHPANCKHRELAKCYFSVKNLKTFLPKRPRYFVGCLRGCNVAPYQSTRIPLCWAKALNVLLISLWSRKSTNIVHQRILKAISHTEWFERSLNLI